MKSYPNYRDVERRSGITWSELTALEPRLTELLWAARNAGATCRQWSDAAGVFSPIQNNLSGLIGFAGKHHRHLVLGSSGAYQVAYWRLYDAVAGLLSSPAVEQRPKENNGQAGAAVVPGGWATTDAAVRCAS
jgi:hypothetical protein